MDDSDAGVRGVVATRVVIGVVRLLVVEVGGLEELRFFPGRSV